MARYITVRLTEAQAVELLAVAGNGYGDGDFYGANDPEPYKFDGHGGRRGENLYSRAVGAVQKALRGGGA